MKTVPEYRDRHACTYSLPMILNHRQMRASINLGRKARFRGGPPRNITQSYGSRAAEPHTPACTAQHGRTGAPARPSPWGPRRKGNEVDPLIKSLRAIEARTRYMGHAASRIGTNDIRTSTYIAGVYPLVLYVLFSKLTCKFQTKHVKESRANARKLESTIRLFQSISTVRWAPSATSMCDHRVNLGLWIKLKTRYSNDRQQGKHIDSVRTAPSYNKGSNQHIGPQNTSYRHLLPCLTDSIAETSEFPATPPLALVAEGSLGHIVAVVDIAHQRANLIIIGAMLSQVGVGAGFRVVEGAAASQRVDNGVTDVVGRRRDKRTCSAVAFVLEVQHIGLLRRVVLQNVFELLLGLEASRRGRDDLECGCGVVRGRESGDHVGGDNEDDCLEEMHG